MTKRRITDRPTLVSMVMLAGVLLGLVSIGKLPIGLLPNISAPGLTVITRYPGVAPEKIEELLTIPLERQLSDVSGIQNLLSISSEGESRINLVFHHDVDIEIKMLEASEKIQRIRTSFPREVEEPGIVRFDPSNRPIYILSLQSDNLDLKKLREIADLKLKLHFERISGVSEVIVGGGFEREIQFLADPSRLAAHAIESTSIMSTLKDYNSFIPGGILPLVRETRLVFDNRYETVGQINEIQLTIPKKENNVDNISITQLGIVKDHWRDRKNISRTNGQDRVSIYIQKAGNANTLSITEECSRILESLKSNPEFSLLKIHISYNQGKAISEAIKRVTQACIFGGIIAIFVLFMFLRRASITFLIGLTIPASVLTTFFFMFLVDVEINVMSLSGLALGAGMLIDNAIVVSEAIDSHLQHKTKVPREAINTAVDFVRWELIASSLTTGIVFIPLAFTTPETRLLYQSLSFTVVISLAVSLLFSLTVVPALALKIEIHKKDNHQNNKSIIEYLAKKINIWNQAVSQKISMKFDWVRSLRIKNNILYLMHTKYLNMNEIKLQYIKVLLKSFRKPTWTISLPLLFLCISPILFSFIKKENSGPLDSGLIEATADLETGTSLEKTQQILSKIETILQNHPAVSEVNSKIEKWHATLHIKTDKDYKRAYSTEDIIEKLKKSTDPFEDAFIYYTLASESQGSQELNIEFYGDDLKEMKSYARKLSGQLPVAVEGIQQVLLRFREPREDIILEPKRYQLALNKSTSSELGGSLRNLLSGAVVSKYYDEDREVDIRYRANPKLFSEPDDLKQLRLSLKSGLVALPVLVDWKIGEGETRIWRKNKRKTIMLTVKSNDRGLDELAEDISSYLKNTSIPSGIIFAFGDEYKRLQEGQKQMIIAVALSILLVYLLLGSLFESISQPLTILLIIPISISVVIGFLLITGMSLSMSVYIGLIMLGGIGVNNAILIVSTVKERLANSGGLSMMNNYKFIRMISKSAQDRLRPILMTTITTMVGMLPMAFDYSDGGSLWRPLAWTVSFGLLVSLIVSLILVPFILLLYYKYLVHKNQS